MHHHDFETKQDAVDAGWIPARRIRITDTEPAIFSRDCSPGNSFGYDFEMVETQLDEGERRVTCVLAKSETVWFANGKCTQMYAPGSVPPGRKLAVDKKGYNPR